MPFRYRLQKILEIRIRKKEEQLQQVIKAQEEVNRIELLIIENQNTIKTLTQQMRSADPMMYEQYDKYIKHLWEEDKKLQQQKLEAIEQLEKEKELLAQREREVKVLEKHKENRKEIYIQEEKARELKELNEIGSQKFFIKNRDLKQEQEEELMQQIKDMENYGN
jgi:flagellar export protein FliJ